MVDIDYLKKLINHYRFSELITAISPPIRRTHSLYYDIQAFTRTSYKLSISGRHISIYLFILYFIFHHNENINVIRNYTGFLCSI